MNYFGHPKTQWAGVEDAIADQIAVAQIGAEHTEAMRRARLDGIWPYMYAGWTVACGLPCACGRASKVPDAEPRSPQWVMRGGRT